MITLCDTGGVSLEGVAPLTGSALVGTLCAWFIYRVFPAFLSRIDRMLDEGQKRADAERVAALARDDARITMFLQSLKEIRDDRSNDREQVHQAFAEFAKTQGEQVSDLSASVRELTNTIREQGGIR